MDKEKIIGVVFNAVGTSSGILLANLISEKIKENAKSRSGSKES